MAAENAKGEAGAYGGITEEGTKRPELLYNRGNNNISDLSTNTKYYVKYGAKAAQNSKTMVKGAMEGAGFVQQGVEKVIPAASGQWKLKDSTMAGIDFYGGTVTADGITALGNLLTAVYGIYNLSTSGSGMHAGDIGANIVKICNSAASATTTVWKGVETVQNYMTATDNLVQGAANVSAGLKVAGMVTAGVSTGLESYNTVSGLLDCRNASKASKFLNRKNQTGEKTDARKAKFEKNMLKVSKDISSRKVGNGSLNTVASGMSVAGLLIPGVGPVISLAGMGLTMASGVVSIFGLDIKSIRKAMFDSYFGFDEFMKKALAFMELKGEKVYDMKEFRRRMRRTLAASAGFADVESACDHIGRKYADYVFAKLFGGEGERTTDENEKNGFIQLIKSFGLPYNEKKKIPGAALLARKMNGR
jgi:hypothetical protein